jgi:hypothetical protein
MEIELNREKKWFETERQPYIAIAQILVLYYYYYYLNFSLLSFQLGNIHLSWDLIINRNRLGGLIYNLESFLQLNMCQELQIFAFVCMYLDAS